MDDIFNDDLKKLKEQQQLPEQEIFMPEEGEVSLEEISKPDYREDLLNRYRQLNQRKNDLNTENLESLQPNQLEGIRSAGLLQAGSQIAQAMASGYGAKIGDNKAGVDLIKDLSSQPVKDFLQKQDTYKKELAITTEDLDLQDDIEMTDPKSDISKFYREQAYSMLKKLSPNNDYSGKLEDMSAKQLMKLPGMKNLTTSAPMQWQMTDRVDEQGNPLRYNRVTGELSRTDGSIVKPGEFAPRDIMRRDALTGQYGLGTAKGMKVLPTVYGEGAKPSGDQVEINKPKDYKYSDIAKAAPKQIEVFDKAKKEFNDDMKMPREVASSITNLASKLKPGKDNEVDSGLLGGIQTQAAKMAGQKGVLTDQDLVKFSGAGGVVPKIERIINGTFFGDMSDSDIKFFKRFSQLMGKSLNEDIENRSQLFVDQSRQQLETIAPGITNENVSKLLGVSKVAPQVQSKNDKVPSDKVRIKTPSGTIMLLPKNKLQDALKKGAVEVK